MAVSLPSFIALFISWSSIGVYTPLSFATAITFNLNPIGTLSNLIFSANDPLDAASYLSTASIL